jgi:hypothetical protein
VRFPRLAPRFKMVYTTFDSAGKSPKAARRAKPCGPRANRRLFGIEAAGSNRDRPIAISFRLPEAIKTRDSAEQNAVLGKRYGAMFGCHLLRFLASITMLIGQCRLLGKGRQTMFRRFVWILVILPLAVLLCPMSAEAG